MLWATPKVRSVFGRTIRKYTHVCLKIAEGRWLLSIRSGVRAPPGSPSFSPQIPAYFLKYVQRNSRSGARSSLPNLSQFYVTVLTAIRSGFGAKTGRPIYSLIYSTQTIKPRQEARRTTQDGEGITSGLGDGSIRGRLHQVVSQGVLR